MTGRYRVLPGRDDEEFLLLDPGTAEPTYVARDGYDGSLADDVASVAVGNLVTAELDWSGETPRFESVDVVSATRFAFTRGASDLFQAALECMEAAERAGEAMNSRLTRDTDGEVNGVLYVFARQQGARDLYGEFRDGTKPLDPLIERIEAAAPPYDVFVIEPAREPFVVVYIALERDGLLARTVRETYFEDGGDGAGETGGTGGLSDLGAFDDLDLDGS